jgi:hypothetical protein
VTSRRMASFPDRDAGAAVLRGIVLEEVHHGPARGPVLVAAIADLEGFSVGEVVDAMSDLLVDGRLVVRTIVARDGDDERAVPLPFWCEVTP